MKRGARLALRSNLNGIEQRILNRYNDVDVPFIKHNFTHQVTGLNRAA
jgi:hypothetical protein